MSRLASVYPIVSARSLARPFTYEIGDEVGKGAVLAIRFGNARRRGVVVDADAEAPPDVEPVAAERVLETLRRRSSTSPSGSRTTTARRRRARSR